MCAIAISVREIHFFGVLTNWIHMIVCYKCWPVPAEFLAQCVVPLLLISPWKWDYSDGQQPRMCFPKEHVHLQLERLSVRHLELERFSTHVLGAHFERPVKKCIKLMFYVQHLEPCPTFPFFCKCAILKLGKCDVLSGNPWLVTDNHALRDFFLEIMLLICSCESVKTLFSPE